MSTPRRRFGTDQKAAILKRYLVDKVPISDLCDEYGIKPNQIYAWQKILFDNAGGHSIRRPTRRQQGVGPGGEDCPAGEQAPAEERGHLRTDGGERPGKKSQWGTLNGRWVPHDTRDEVVDYVAPLERADGDSGPAVRRLGWASARASSTTGKTATASGTNTTLGAARLVARRLGEAGDHPLLLRVSAGGLSAVGVYDARPRRGGRQPVERLSRVEGSGRIGRSTSKPSRKARVFISRREPHEHWHIDISYVQHHGTFYHLTTILDGYSRYIVHWEIRRSMKEQDELTILQQDIPQRDAANHQRQRSQFLAKDLQDIIRICRMTHVPAPSRCTRKATANWSIKASLRSNRHANLAGGRSKESWAGIWSTTTTCSCARASATRGDKLRRAAKRKSSPHGTGSWSRLQGTRKEQLRKLLVWAVPDPRHVTMRVMTWAEDGLWWEPTRGADRGL